MVLLFDERIFEMTAQQPEDHIKNHYTLAEIKTKIASNDYNAEMLLQHAMRLLDSMATLCTDMDDAEQEAKYANMAWPHTAKNSAAPFSSFYDSRTQAVYEVLINDNYPPAGSNEHWEGWKARLIVDALFPEAPAAQVDAVAEVVIESDYWSRGHFVESIESCVSVVSCCSCPSVS